MNDTGYAELKARGASYRAMYEHRATLGGRLAETATLRLEALTGLTDDEVAAAESEASYMQNTEPGWRPSDALRAAARKIRAARGNYPEAAGIGSKAARANLNTAREARIG